MLFRSPPLPANFSLSNQSLDSLLKNCLLLITTGSSAEIDAATMNIPVLLLGQETGIPFSSLAQIGITPTYADTPAAINPFLTLCQETKILTRQADSGARIQRLCLNEFTEKTLSVFWHELPHGG